MFINKDKTIRQLSQTGTYTLSGLLIVLAVFLIWVAMYEKSPLVKAAVAAWVILP